MVGIWERIWADHKAKKVVLEYDILGTPHHCSWRSLGRVPGRGVAAVDKSPAEVTVESLA